MRDSLHARANAARSAQRQTANMSALLRGRQDVQTLQRTFGNRAVGATVQRLIHLEDKKLDLAADDALARVLPFLNFTSFEAGDYKALHEALLGLDKDNKSFESLADLASGLRTLMDAPKGAKSLTVLPQIMTILSLDDFEKMVTKFKIPASDQQVLAGQIRENAKFVWGTYKEVQSMMEATGKKKPTAESIMRFFTASMRKFSSMVVQDSMELFGHRLGGDIPIAVLMAGSGAREEMFPGSDLDLAVLTDTKKENTEKLFEFTKLIESRLSATMQYITVQLNLTKDVGLAPDTGVFGFAHTPELLAAKTVGMQNVAQDAAVVHVGEGGEKLPERFFQARDEATAPKQALGELKDRLVEFGTPQIKARIDIKKDFLRLPTLVLRELATFFQLKSTNSFDRVRELVSTKQLDGGLGGSLIDALEVISRIRIRLHLHHKSEFDEAAFDESGKKATTDYVLSKEEQSGLQKASDTLARFHEACMNFVASGGTEGLAPSKAKSKWNIFG